jgi:hypothetical protein
MSRIQLKDTEKDVLIKMSDGNPGALTAMMEMLEKDKDIDPQAFRGGMSAILLLDTFEIYGTDIYILWNDQCNRDVRRLLMLLRAVQLGFIPDSLLQSIGACQTRENLLSQEEMDALDKKVCTRLSQFQRPNEKE